MQETKKTASQKPTKKQKRQRWLKFRHRVVRNVAFATLGVFCRLKYRARVERFRGQEKRPYLILMNHQTPFDQFFVGMSFRGPIYYLATEDIFSLGWLSSCLRYLVAPIPIQKQTVDVKAVMTCMRVAREGGTIAICPEGNRTYSGRTEYMNPSIATLCRSLKLPIVLYRLEGGYGVQPRWSDTVRKGGMRCYVSRVLQPEEYASLSDEELFAAIREGLYVDDTRLGGTWRHKRSAEYLERVLYVCPTCGLSSFYSDRDTVECLTCHTKVRHLPSLELQGGDGEFPYRHLSQWYDAQMDFVNDLDTTLYCEEPLFRDTVRLSEVIPYSHKEKLAEGVTLSLYGDRVTAEAADGRAWELPYARITGAAVLGRNKLNIYIHDKIYQIKGDERFNALKYVHIYHRYKNQHTGDGHGIFLGL